MENVEAIDILVGDRRIFRMVRININDEWIAMPNNLIHDNLSTKGYGNMGRVTVSNSQLELAFAYLVGA